MTDTFSEAAGWYDAKSTTFGDRLTGAREAANLSHGDLARRLGVKTKTVQGWENDQNEPRANKLQMLAGILGVSIMWLLTGEGDGVDAPEDFREVPDDVARLLGELRRMRLDQARLAEGMARVEKRLRLALSEAG